MNRLALLVGAFLLFASVPYILVRASAVPPRWRVRLALLSLIGLGLTLVSLLSALLLPEVLAASDIGQLWALCARAFEAILESPLDRLPSLVAGAALAILLGRLMWSLLTATRAGHRVRVKGRSPRWRLAGGHPVYVLPVDVPAAYSVGCLRGQAVVSRGLLAALDAMEARAVLRHEEGHLRGRHHLLLLVARAVRSALAPLPAVPVGLAVLEQALEETADEYAATALGSRGAVASGISRAALAGLEGPVGALSVAAGPDVPARVRRLLDPPEAPRWAGAACVLAVGLLAGFLAVTMAIAGLAAVAATHHLVGLGTAVVGSLSR